MKQRLAALESSAAARAGQLVTRRALELPEMKRAENVLCCLSFGDEIDTGELIERLLDSGRRVLVPRVRRGDPRLYLHEYPCSLETLSFGLRQPPASTPTVSADAPDLAVILGLAFDREGYRLGYGAGYFDRFLASRSLLALGLCYDCQLVECLPREQHDVPMTVVATESATVRPCSPGTRD